MVVYSTCPGVLPRNLPLDADALPLDGTVAVAKSPSPRERRSRRPRFRAVLHQVDHELDVDVALTFRRVLADALLRHCIRAPQNLEFRCFRCRGRPVSAMAPHEIAPGADASGADVIMSTPGRLGRVESFATSRRRDVLEPFPLVLAAAPLRSPASSAGALRGPTTRRRTVLVREPLALPRGCSADLPLRRLDRAPPFGRRSEAFPMMLCSLLSGPPRVDDEQSMVLRTHRANRRPDREDGRRPMSPLVLRTMTWRGAEDRVAEVLAPSAPYRRHRSSPRWDRASISVIRPLDPVFTTRWLPRIRGPTRSTCCARGRPYRRARLTAREETLVATPETSRVATPALASVLRPIIPIASRPLRPL